MGKLFKDGQKNITPIAADATRAFYESLLKEKPDSKLAIKFCVEYGVMASPAEHKKLLAKYLKLKEKGAYNARAPVVVPKNKEKKEKDDRCERHELVVNRCSISCF